MLRTPCHSPLHHQGIVPPRPYQWTAIIYDLYESSIADPDPQDVTAVAHVDTYKIIKETSIRGMNKLFDSIGYSYTVKRRNGHCTTWRCSLRSKTVNCTATVRQEEGVFLPGPREHIHQPNLGAAIIASITHECKSKANAHPFKSAGEIVGGMIAEFVPDNKPCPALPNITRLAGNANYHRRRNHPQRPQDLDFQLNMDHIPDNFLRWDIPVEGARHLLFASDVQLDLMSNAKTWYVDATFHVMYGSCSTSCLRLMLLFGMKAAQNNCHWLCA